MRRLPLVVCICWVPLIAPSHAPASGEDFLSRLEELKAEMQAIVIASSDEHEWQNSGGALAAAYRRSFPDDLLDSLTEDAKKAELTELFYATFNYLHYVGRESEATKLEIVFERLEEKGWADHKIIDAMHRVLLTFRRFDEAAAFRREHPKQRLPAPPPIVPLSRARGDDVRIVLLFINHGSALQRQAIDLRSSTTVLVIGHPRCHFSQNAVTAIAADDELSEAMSAAAIWLTPPSSSLTDGAVAEWNRENPAYAYRYVELKSEWPEVNYWGTPSFYFIRDGELVKKVVGWPNDAREQRKEALRAGLRAIGAWGGGAEKKSRP